VHATHTPSLWGNQVHVYDPHAAMRQQRPRKLGMCLYTWMKRERRTEDNLARPAFRSTWVRCEVRRERKHVSSAPHSGENKIRESTRSRTTAACVCLSCFFPRDRASHVLRTHAPLLHCTTPCAACCCCCCCCCCQVRRSTAENGGIGGTSQCHHSRIHTG